MNINEEKNWFNNLSETGKRITKLNIILARAQSNIKVEEKDKKNKGFLSLSSYKYSKNKNKYLDDEEINDIDIFSITKTEKLNLKRIKTNKNYKKINNFLKKTNKKRKKYIYHDFHMKNLKKKEVQNYPSCTKYNPKYNSIRKDVKSLPLWEKITGRIYHKKKDSEHKFYLQHENIENTMAGKTFIDMSKQILKRYFDNPEKIKEQMNKTNYNININSSINRRPLTGRTEKNFNHKRISSGISSYSDISEQNTKNYNVLSRPESSFILKKKIKKHIFKKKIGNSHNESKAEKSTNINTSNINNLIDISNNNINKNNLNNINNINKNDEDKTIDSFVLFKDVYIKKKNKNIKKNNNSSNIVKKIRKQKINAPDFNKCLSRESLSKLEDNKTSVTPYLFPNFEAVRPKPIMMVVYDRKKHKINRVQSASLLNLNNRNYYDENKALNKINNHIEVHPPDFDRMKSRPIDDDPLPSYMKKIYDRNSCYGISAYSLKLNNFKNRDSSYSKSSFWPKLSFNKVINLNLLKSKKFIDCIISKEDRKEIKNKIIGKIMKFYSKNCNYLLREEELPKFDNITFKSFNKTRKI